MVNEALSICLAYLIVYVVDAFLLSWQCLTRPIIVGPIAGLILGDLKTGIILGMGETNEEVLQTMRELRAVDVDILTLGQYLRPSDDHIVLDRYVTPEEFRMFRHEGMAMGFRHVESAPLVRSSYHAWEQVQAAGVAEG